MAGGADRRTFVLALSGTGLAALLARFPLGDAASGLWFLAIAAASFLLLGLPVLLAEAAFGQYRRRNVVDAHGPGAWKAAGAAHALGALVAAALLAVLAGWAARYAYGSFQGTWFDDPDRHARLLSEGPDALLWTLGVLAVATAVAVRGAGRGRGLRGVVAAGTVLALVLLGGVAAWANLQDGAASGREGLYDPESDGVNGSFAVAAVLAGLLPALLATGLAATLGARLPDRALLPRDAGLAGLVAGLGLALALLGLAALASAQGHALEGGALPAFGTVPALFAAIGGAAGGFLAGAFYGALLLASLVALLGLLEVPATWLAESVPSWTEGRGLLAAGLVAFLVAAPFCFSAAGVGHLGEALAWVAAPLGGLLVSLHVGWARPQVLEGLAAGEARSPLDRFLRPVLRFALAPAFLLLLVLGALGFALEMGWAAGSAGLWRLAP